MKKIIAIVLCLVLVLSLVVEIMIKVRIHMIRTTKKVIRLATRLGIMMESNK